MVHSIKICPFSEARRLGGAHMCTGGRVDVQYVTFLLLLVFECVYAITRSWDMKNFLRKFLVALDHEVSKCVRKQISNGFRMPWGTESYAWVHEDTFRCFLVIF